MYIRRVSYKIKDGRTAVRIVFFNGIPLLLLTRLHYHAHEIHYVICIIGQKPHILIIFYTAIRRAYIYTYHCKCRSDIILIIQSAPAFIRTNRII